MPIRRSPARRCAALGDIGNSESAKALNAFAKKAPNEVKPALTDALLANAERLLADGKKAEAIQIYKSLSGEDQPKLIRLAATHGLLFCRRQERLK